MQQAAVIGSPISHSKSPAIFAFLSDRTGKSDFRYFRQEVTPDALAGFVRSVRDSPDWVGFNVTIPHKEKILPILGELSGDVRAIGAVNAVSRRGNLLLGHNTDTVGIRCTLQESHATVLGRNCLIFGAGGAARALAHVLAELGSREILICHPHLPRVKSLVDDCNQKFPSSRFRAIDSLNQANDSEVSLVANATPLGMLGVTSAADGRDAAEIFSALKTLKKSPDALAFDLIYNPEHTPFLKNADEAGFRTVGGLTMFVEQALATWELWFGRLSDRDRLRVDLHSYLRDLLKSSTEDSPILLSGFMGSGKSAVGAALAESMGWAFLDTDRLIETEAGQNIPDIFATQGEGVFRNLEQRMVMKAASERRSVVALGGGALQNAEVFAKLQSAGRLVYLHAEASTLEARLESEAHLRPLLLGLDAAQRSTKIRELLAAREPVYRKARFRVETDHLSPTEVARRILQEISRGMKE